MSLFYHPFIEYQYITVTRDGNSFVPTVTYPENSPLHQIIDEIYNTGAGFVSITDIK